MFKQCKKFNKIKIIFWFKILYYRSQRLRFRLNLYELQENRHIKPKTFSSMVSNLLYERRFGPYFIEPIIAGLDPKTSEPFISVMDLIGQPCISKDFAVVGTANEQLYGMCETLWQPELVWHRYIKKISTKIFLIFLRNPMICLKQFHKP